MELATLLLAALGMAIFIEGLPYFITPPGVRRSMSELCRLSDGALRTLGFALMSGGLILAYLALH